MGLRKLLGNFLDKSSKLKNMSDAKLRCLTKSLLSQNFYLTISDLLKTIILHPMQGFIQAVSDINILILCTLIWADPNLILSKTEITIKCKTNVIYCLFGLLNYNIGSSLCCDLVG